MTTHGNPEAGGPAPPPSTSQVLRWLYELLASPGFALFVVIALGVASLLGIFIIDQIPFRGSVARMHYGEQGGLVPWLLIHLTPEQPFRCLLYRTLLGLLSLSLLACVIKRWRQRWRQALTHPDPERGAYDGPQSVAWDTRKAPAASQLGDLLQRRLFAVRLAEGEGAWRVAASRWGIARLGPVLTHLGFLLLVIGGLWMSSTGSSQMVWMGSGDRFDIPGTAAHLRLDDFRITMGPGGRVSDYISSVRLMQDTTVIRATEIEVNRPLRYRGRSFYQSSYRQNPTAVRALSIVVDAPVDSPAAAGATAPDTVRAAPGGMQPGHQHGMSPTGTGRSDAFANPMTMILRPGEVRALPGTPYAVAIDTFLIDFRIVDGHPQLASIEPRNPAARLAFYTGDQLIGRTWYFIRHPDMPVGNGPDIPLRAASFEPHMLTGLEMATHPGAGWVWAGIVVMSLGTVLAFLVRHERIWVRVTPRNQPAGVGWEIAVVHTGAETQDLARVKKGWAAAITPLVAELLEQWPPAAGAPSRWPGAQSVRNS